MSLTRRPCSSFQAHQVDGVLRMSTQITVLHRVRYVADAVTGLTLDSDVTADLIRCHLFDFGETGNQRAGHRVGFAPVCCRYLFGQPAS